MLFRMRANAEDTVPIVDYTKEKSVASVYTTLPNVFAFAVFLSPQGRVAEIVREKRKLLSHLRFMIGE
jgi:hypothetical protein